MKGRTRTLLLVTIALVAAALAAAYALETRAGDSPGAPAARGDLDRSAVRSFTRFALYSLGNSYEGVPLTAITRRDDAAAAGERVRADYVGFVYGDCVARDENGCAPPLEVQVWPACVRSLADYTLTPVGAPLPHEATMVRGVPAALFEDGLRLELYTGNVTVVIFGLEQAQVLRAAAALR